eukprot:TRINITY_DN27881_c0_g1_i1.p1 TRINITY_DN27881_c0_g1~~TRINITY_DN27881_c0_g1_i1.p1  ORF type:complete len:165 (+),score=13.19 TRINITY_DN27881_c0_g1_i1:141-635(+)
MVTNRGSIHPGGPGWADVTGKCHQFLLDRYVMDREIKVYDTQNHANNRDEDDLYFSPNDNINKLSDSIACAAKLVHSTDPIVLIVGDGIISDWTSLSFLLWEKYRMKTIAKTYAEIGLHGTLEAQSQGFWWLMVIVYPLFIAAVVQNEKNGKIKGNGLERSTID